MALGSLGVPAAVGQRRAGDIERVVRAMALRHGKLEDGGQTVLDLPGALPLVMPQGAKNVDALGTVSTRRSMMEPA